MSFICSQLVNVNALQNRKFNVLDTTTWHACNCWGRGSIGRKLNKAGAGGPECRPPCSPCYPCSPPSADTSRVVRPTWALSVWVLLTLLELSSSTYRFLYSFLNHYTHTPPLMYSPTLLIPLTTHAVMSLGHFTSINTQLIASCVNLLPLSCPCSLWHQRKIVLNVREQFYISCFCWVILNNNSLDFWPWDKTSTCSKINLNI